MSKSIIKNLRAELKLARKEAEDQRKLKESMWEEKRQAQVDNQEWRNANIELERTVKCQNERIAQLERNLSETRKDREEGIIALEHMAILVNKKRHDISMLRNPPRTYQVTPDRENQTARY